MLANLLPRIQSGLVYVTSVVPAAVRTSRRDDEGFRLDDMTGSRVAQHLRKVRDLTQNSTNVERNAAL
jgi:hypothetical protein